MKILSKLMVIILLSSTGMAQAFPSFFSIAVKGSLIWTAFMGPAISAARWIQYHRKIQHSPDTSEIVTHFCHKKLIEHGLNPEQIRIKVKEDCGFLETFGTSYIVFSPIAANEFKNALEDPSDEKSSFIVKIYSTFLDHEIAHAKNNDTLKRQGMLLGLGALSYGAATYLIKRPRFSPLFQKPTNKKGLLRVVLAYSLVNVVSSLLIKNLYGWYARYQENRADAYAISHAKDPLALRCSAVMLETFDNTIIDFLCGTDLHPSIPQIPLIYMRNAIVAQYKKLQPKEDFRTWVKQQTKTLSLIKYILDVEHPSGSYRAKIMRAAADALELEQKITVNTTLPEAVPAA